MRDGTGARSHPPQDAYQVNACVDGYPVEGHPVEGHPVETAADEGWT